MGISFKSQRKFLIRTTDGRVVRILVIIDKYTRECLSVYAARSIKHQEVLDQL
jgi:hypothetical protein